MYLKITLHSVAAEEMIKNHITFLDPGGINYVIIVGPTVARKCLVKSRRCQLITSHDLFCGPATCAVVVREGFSHEVMDVGCPLLGEGATFVRRVGVQRIFSCKV